MSGTELTAFKAMQTDIQISMDDVVSAFVSQYENNLYTRKKELTTAIKAVEGQHSDFIKALHKNITGASFISVAMPLDLVATVDDGTVNWDKAKIKFQISVTQKNNSRYGNTIAISRTKSIPSVQVKTHGKLIDELDTLRSDLSEVLVSLKSVTRKERQVRGRIAIRKLEDSGYASLMQDPELVKLVELDD